MPTPFAGAAATEATNVPWYSLGPLTDCSFRNVVFGRPANSGCVGSVPLSTIVIGTPGPGGVARSAPTSASHHSCASSGSVAPRAVAGVAVLETGVPPRGLLDLLLAVEARFGRDRASVPAQGPRTLDLDLLLYGDEEIDEPGLRIPHPRLAERAFVLRPLAELEPDLVVPGKGPILALLARLH